LSHSPSPILPSLSFYAHTLDLSLGAEALFNGFESGVRRAIRKAEQAGLSIEISSSIDAVNSFYSLHCLTRHRHGLPPQPFSFFLNIHRHILSQKMGFVALARRGQTPIAASVFFHLGKKATYKFGRSDNAFQQYRGNNWVMWRAIQECVSPRLHSTPFRSKLPSPTKVCAISNSAGELRKIKMDYFRYDFRKKACVTIVDRTEGWHIDVFRKVPIPLSRLIGSFIYKHLS